MLTVAQLEEAQRHIGLVRQAKAKLQELRSLIPTKDCTFIVLKPSAWRDRGHENYAFPISPNQQLRILNEAIKEAELKFGESKRRLAQLDVKWED